MSKDIIFQRVLHSKCPICDKAIKNQETALVSFGEGKVLVCKEHIKFENKDE